jgi:acetolactate synthase-1/2/3 large subunit
MLQESKRPLIYAGGGVINSNATDELREFAERFQIPVVTTLLGIGAMDTMNPLALHMLGMHGTAYANYAVEDCDFLIAVGSRFDDRVAGKVQDFAPLAKNMAHIDIDAAEINKVKIVTWSHVGDARNTLRDLIHFGKEFKKDFSTWVQHIVELKQKYMLNYDRESKLIKPQYIMETLNKLTNGEAIIASGVGQHQMWSAQYFHYKHPRHWLTSGSMGTMGFGLPASIGAKVANPDQIVIDVDGDGSIRMNFGDLETITTYNIPVKVVLMNNLGDGMVRQWQKLMYDWRFCATDKTLHKKDFIKAAEADGFEFAKRLTNKEDVEKTLKEFVEFDGPAFLEVMIDPDAMVFPMVGPGKGYKEMMTGDWIKKRDYSDYQPDDEGPDLF